MKRFLQFLFSFLAFAMLTCMACNALQSHISPLITTVAMLALVIYSATLRKTRVQDVFKASVDVEIWVNYIMDRFWEDNAFLKYAFNDDQYVINGQIVHIPQRGSKPNVIKNRSSFPGTIVQRGDSDITYVLDDYSTDPTQITNIEEMQVSYDKMSSVLDDHLMTLNETVADDILIKWLLTTPAANIIYTTGAATDVGSDTGQTGQRNAMVHQDLKSARKQMNRKKVPQNDRYALLESDMYEQFTDSLTNTQYRDFSQYYDASTGIVGKLYGFNIMTRASVAMAANALNGSNQLAVNALGAAVLPTDNVVSICWQKNAVARALGSVMPFERLQDPEYLGDIYAVQVRMGGRRRRSDDLGVIAIVQGTPNSN
jgi:hypothetical protein